MKFEILAGIVGVFSISGILMAISGAGGTEAPREEPTRSISRESSRRREEKIDFTRERVVYPSVS